MHCSCHILNFIVRDDLKYITPHMTKIRHAITFIFVIPHYEQAFVSVYVQIQTKSEGYLQRI